MGDVIDFDSLKNFSMQANMNAVNALMYIKDYCSYQHKRKCNADRCILYKWCKGSDDRFEEPCNWQVIE